MNVASLELCKELYGLSGWGDTSHRYYVGDGYDGKLMDEHYWTEHFADEGIREGDIIPAYDSGYLLRKLPNKDGFKLQRVDQDMWKAGIAGIDRSIEELATTVENALANLCILLIKQGVLNPK